MLDGDQRDQSIFLPREAKYFPPEGGKVLLAEIRGQNSIFYVGSRKNIYSTTACKILLYMCYVVRKDELLVRKVKN